MKNVLVLALALLLTACNGYDGAQGATGATGAPGKNGTNGTNGKDGSNGTNGVDSDDDDASESVVIVARFPADKKDCPSGGVVILVAPGKNGLGSDVASIRKVLIPVCNDEKLHCDSK